MEDDRPFDDEAPLEEDERVALQQDLIDVEVLKEVLRPKGIKGAVFYCPDCEEDHYLSWDLLAGNLKELLDAGESPVHEPAFDPDPDQYVSWDYARGFLDGYESFEQEELTDVTLRLAQELRERGWSAPEVVGVLDALGLELTSPEDPPTTGVQ
ncbi:MAG: DUF5319 domain-containing protein [Actinomycetota bacterium]|nr:DUF5319 domain-containing protein [Actinomycetota bacterium]